MQANQDFRDLFAELNAAGADYLVVGAMRSPLTDTSARPRTSMSKRAAGRLQDLADIERLEGGE